MKTFLRTIALICIVAIVSSCKGKQNANQQSLTVKSEVATSITQNPQKEFSFISKPYRSSELSFRVSGPVTNFEAIAGNYYRKGETIAAIDSRDFVIAKQRAEAVYNQAKAEFERIEVLFNKNNVAASVYERAKAEYAAAKAAFDTASNQLTDTRLTAPFNGYIGQTFIEKFQDVKASQRIVTIDELDRLKIETFVTAEIAANASKIDKVNLRFDAMPEQLFTAKLAEVSRSTTTNNISYLLTATLDNGAGKLLSGMSGKIIFDAIPMESIGITIPQTALCHSTAKGDYVWVADKQGKVTSRAIKIGALQPNSRVVVTEGLTEGEIVVTTALRFLSDGMQVKLN